MELTFHDCTQDLQDNFIYTIWVKNLVDSNVYDTGDKAYPYLTTPLTFRITSTDPTMKTVYFNDTLIYSSTDLVFDIKVYPSTHAANNIYAKDEYGSRTTTYHFRVYQLHFFIFVVASEVYNLFKNVQQSDADRTLTDDNSSGILGSNVIISDKALFRIFGNFLEVQRINDTHAQYLQKLKYSQDAFYYVGTIGGIKKILNAFTTCAVDFVTYYNLEELRSSTSNLVRRKDTLEVEWFPSHIVFQGQQFFLDYGTAVLGSSGETFLYVDGTVDVNHYLVMKTSATEPVGYKTTLTENHSIIYTDTDGTLTGIINGKYIILNHPVLELLSVTSSGPINVQGAELLENSSVLNLHTGWDSTDIGVVTVQYDADIRPIVAARVTTTSDITKIEDPRPSRGAIYRTKQKEESDFEIYLGDDSLSDREIQQLLDLLKEINTATATGHLYVKDLSVNLPEYEYHKNNYRFVGLI